MNAMTIQEALLKISEYWQPKRIVETVPVTQAVGRVSAQNVYSKITLPVERSAKIDSIVVHSKNFEQGVPNTSNWVRGKDFDRADMGDDFSDIFDAAIPVETVKFTNNEQNITFVTEVNMGIARANFSMNTLEVKPGTGLNKKGSIIQEGDTLVAKNTTILPTMLANLVLGGHKTIDVLKKPTVAFIPTGTELIPAGSTPERGQTIDINSTMVQSFLQEWQTTPIMYSIVKDQKTALEENLNTALQQADIVLINGGSSKGEEDFNSALIKKNATFFQHHFLAVPGRPASVAVHGEKLIINVPGPPLATFGVCHWMVKPLIHYYYNNTFLPSNKVKVRLLNTKPDNLGVSVCVWFAVSKQEDEYVATAYFRDSKLSSVLGSVNAYAFLPANNNAFNKGDYLEVLWIK